MDDDHCLREYLRAPVRQSTGESVALLCLRVLYRSGSCRFPLLALATSASWTNDQNRVPFVVLEPTDDMLLLR